MNIYFDKPVMIFKEVVKKHDGTTFTKYNASMSKKGQDGEYVYSSFPIEFLQGVELHHKSKITIKPGDAWLSFYQYQITVDGEKKNRYNTFIKCKAFDVVEGGLVDKEEHTMSEKNKQNINDVFKDFGDTVVIENDNSFLD